MKKNSDTIAKSRLEAADRFWIDVKKLLKKRHRHTDHVAQQGIAEYRREAEPKAGEVIYNQGEEQTAEIIHRRIAGVTGAKKRVI